MIDDMPRPLPPHLRREKTRHGRFVWYVRVGHGPRIRLSADYGSPEFSEQYQAALCGEAAVSPKSARSGNLEWLWDRYRETGAWAALSVATRRQRENIMVHVLETAGADPLTGTTRKAIEAGKDRRRDTPSQARHFLDTMRGLFRWAEAAGHVSRDPTHGVASPKRRTTAGFAVWTEDDVAAYESRWPTGSRQRVWLHVLLYTGMRRGDAVRLGKQHVRDGVATLKTQKTGTEVSIPILPVLAATLAAGPCGDLAFVCGESGRPFTKESFGNAFSEACRDAGVRKSAHGVRKIGATRAANAGATVAELEAIFGWSGGGMAALYTRAADRRRLAQGAMVKLSGTAGKQAIPAPDEKVRDRG